MIRLVVGLGNPGRAYKETRHNLGFMIVERFAKKHDCSFRKSEQFSAKLASGLVAESKVYLLLPLTYMNKSGDAVSRVSTYYHIPASHILVVCDDINIPLGESRLKREGSAGGHNGLKSIEAHFGPFYARLRVGVGDRVAGDLADYVLSPFTPQEKEELPMIIDHSVATIEQWLKLGE